MRLFRKNSIEFNSLPYKKKNLWKTATNKFKQRNYIATFEPRSFEDASFIANHLKKGRSGIVNLNRLSEDKYRRLLDFLSGTIFIIDGSVKKIGKRLYLLTPNTVHISSQTNIMPSLYEINYYPKQPHVNQFGNDQNTKNKVNYFNE